MSSQLLKKDTLRRVLKNAPQTKNGPSSQDVHCGGTVAVMKGTPPPMRVLTEKPMFPIYGGNSLQITPDRDATCSRGFEGGATSTRVPKNYSATNTVIISLLGFINFNLLHFLLAQ